MIAAYIITTAWAAAVLFTAGHLWIAGVAYGLTATLRALAGGIPTQPSPQGAGPSESHYSASRAIAHQPIHMLQWPRDN